jgi:transcriptional regulator with XRE-family HTH domain
MPHPHIARLELGEHNPSVEMLQRLAKGLDRRFIVAVSPENQPDLPLPPGAEVLADVTSPDGTRLVAAVT